MSARQPIGIGVIGFGWMGQAHSRAMRKIPMHFPNRGFDPVSVICSDTIDARARDAVSSFGFAESTNQWQQVIDHPGVDVVVCTAPNMLHLPIIEAAAAAGKDIICEKPVGGTPAQTARAEMLARQAGIRTGVGYNYRWAPMVLYAKELIDSGVLGTITNYRGQFFSMYGADPMGLLTWRFLVDEGGYGVTSDILSHSVDLAQFLLGPITDVVASTHTFIGQRPLPKAGGTHYDHGSPDDPTGTVTNEDYVGMLCRFANGVQGTFESSRAIIGPESQNAFQVYGTKGSATWNFERMNELQVYVAAEHKHTGYTTVFGGERFPYHGAFVPGSANGIGFEDLVVIEDHSFLDARTTGRVHAPGFSEALDFVSVQDAVLRSAANARWESVTSLRIESP